MPRHSSSDAGLALYQTNRPSDYDSLVTAIAYCTSLINIETSLKWICSTGARYLSLPALKNFKQDSYIDSVPLAIFFIVGQQQQRIFSQTCSVSMELLLDSDLSSMLEKTNNLLY